jgi:hypothetical protein
MWTAASCSYRTWPARGDTPAAVLVLLGYAKVITVLTQYNFWFAIAASALLLVATIVKGL